MMRRAIAGIVILCQEIGDGDEEHGICYGVKRQITHSNCVRGRFWGMHRIDFVLASNLRFLAVR